MTDPEVSVRRAVTADLGHLSRLFVELDEHHIRLRPDVFKPLEGPARDLETLRALIVDTARQAVFVASPIGAEPCGLLHVFEKHWPETPVTRATKSAEIDALMVSASHRRNAVAKALIKEAELWAKDRGLDRFTLSVRAFNTEAIAAYACMGFEHVALRMTRAIAG